MFGALLFCLPLVAALGQRSCITFDCADSSAFVLADAKSNWGVPIVLDSSDHPSIHIAASTFADDIERVSGVRPQLYNDTVPDWASKAIVVASHDSSLLTSRNVSWLDSLSGQWEAYEAGVVETEGVETLVIAGSDKRGTIYGLYTLSEQMGVSPWYWWADVPVSHQDTVAFLTNQTCSHGEPTVKFRGFFINDEQPVLTSWAMTHFNLDKKTPPFGPWVYEPMFELILRLKANYFWPAMWASAFDVDGLDVSQGLPSDPIAGPNQVLADRMGIVMGTSHQEPMARNTPEWNSYGVGPWNFTSNAEVLSEFWTYGAERAKGKDTLFTMGMRGNGDLPLPGANIPIMENITAAQQDILRKTYNVSDLSEVPQMWAMYKEVMGYFASGLSVPDDVTILLADDNWGNLMAVLPWGENHTAGGGVYYHVDYVGDPRDYKWINTVPLAKMWEQLNIAHSFKTENIWILNVGDMKLLELPIEYFLNLAYDFDAWPLNSLITYLEQWATREFTGANATEVADIMATYSQYVSRIKPELLNSTTFSLLNYNEAETILKNWQDLEYRSKCVYEQLDQFTQNSYFELVHSAIALNTNLNKLYISAGKSNLFASQFRSAANSHAYAAMDALTQDFNLSQQYEQLYDGKWIHMLSQPHINYAYWQQPMRNTLPPVSFVQLQDPSHPTTWAQIRYTVEGSAGAWPGDNPHNCAQGYSCPDPIMPAMDPYGATSRWVEVSAGGTQDVSWTATPNVTWLSVIPSSGWISADGSRDVKTYISVDWSAVAKMSGNASSYHGVVTYLATDGSTVNITVPVNNTAVPPADWHGFVEGDGYVVIEAAHIQNSTESGDYGWQEIAWYGRTLSGLEMLPATNQNFSLGSGPSVSYNFWSVGDVLNSTTGTVNVTVQIGPSLNFMLGQFLSFGLQLDNAAPIEIHPVPSAALGSLPADWNSVTAAEVRNVSMALPLEDWQNAQGHTLTLWGMTTGVVMERIWIDFGGISTRGYSYLGPPESKLV